MNLVCMVWGEGEGGGDTNAYASAKQLGTFTYTALDTACFVFRPGADVGNECVALLLTVTLTCCCYCCCPPRRHGMTVEEGRQHCFFMDSKVRGPDCLGATVV